MRLYVVSLGTGLWGGVVYGLLHVCSPAPPFVALPGILLGRQFIPVSKQLLAGRSLAAACQYARPMTSLQYCLNYSATGCAARPTSTLCAPPLHTVAATASA